MHPKALAHHQSGLNYQQQGNLRAAAEEYERALAIDARLDLTRMNLAAVLYQLGDHDGAVTHYRQVLEVQPDNLKVVYNLGVAHSAAGHLPDAVTHFLRCLKLDQNFLPALTSLNWIYQQQGNTQGAITVMGQIARLSPEDHATRYQYGVTLRENSREQEAVTALRSLVTDHQGHLAGRLLLAELMVTSDSEAAWEQLSEIWTRDQGFVGSRDLGERVVRAAVDRAASAGDPKVEMTWLERLLKLRPREGAVIRRLADLYRGLDRTTRAITLYQDLIELRPDDPDPALLLASCLRRIGKRSEAQAALTSLLVTHPNHTGALMALAELRLEMDRADQAEGLLHRALVCDPSLIAARISLANVQVRLGRDEEAYRSMVELAAERASDTELHKAGAALCRKLATAYQRAGTEGDDTAKRDRSAVLALLWWERYLEFTSEDAKVLELLGALYRQRQVHVEAARIYERLAAIRPEPAIWHLLGSCRIAAGDATGAAQAFQSALDRAKTTPRTGGKDETIATRVALAEALKAAGRLTEAVAAAQEVLVVEPEHLVAKPLARQGLIQLAENATAGERHNEAAERWKGAINLGKDAQALRRLAAALEKVDDLTSAENAHFEVLAEVPEDRASLAWLGERCLVAHRSEEARNWFRRLLTIDGDHLRAMTALADLAWGAGDRAEAYDLYERIVARDPSHIAGVLTFARDALAADQPGEAWEYARRVLARHPGHEDTTAIALDALRQLAISADPAQAIDWWQRLVALQPEAPDALRGLSLAYRKLGAPVEAAAAAERLLAVLPTDSEAALFLADHYKRSGNFEAARQALEPPAMAGDGDALLALSRLERTAENWPAVRECLRRLLYARPGDPVAFTGIAEADLAEGRAAEAWGLLENLVIEGILPTEGIPIATEAARAVARSRETSGNTTDAIGWWRRALQASPADEEALRALFNLYRDGETPESAAQIARGILSRTPADREAACYLARYLIEKGKLQEAGPILAPIAEEPDAAFLLALIAWKAPDISKARVHLAEVRRQVPRHLEAARLLALVAKAEGQFEEAWNALQEVLALRPEDEDALAAQPQLCRDATDAAGRPDVAVIWWRRLVALRPDDLDARADHAAALSKSGLYGEAAEAYQELAGRSPRDPRWPTLQGDALRQAGRTVEAATALRSARILAPDDPFTALSLAQLAESAERNEDAYKAALDALRLVPDDGEARRIALHSCLRLAEAARIQGDMAGVSRWLERATDHRRGDADLWKSLGEARRLAGDAIGAAAAYAHLWELVPEDLDAAYMAAELFRASGDLTTARQLYLGILERDGEHRATLLTLARLLWQEKDLSGARWYFGRVLASLESEDNLAVRRQVLTMLAGVAWQEGSLAESFERACQAMAICLEGSPEFNQARALGLKSAQQLATIADRENDPETAKKWWAEVARIAPEDRRAFKRLADIAMKGGEIEEATRMFRVLWETDGTDDEAALSLAEGYLALGRRELARETFEEAAARAANPDAAVALAKMAAEDGDPDGSWRWADAARQLAPDDSVVVERASDAALALASRAQDAGNKDDERLWWDRLSELRPSGRNRLLPLARGQARCGDLAAAAGTLLRLWEEAPGDVLIAWELAETLLSAGDLEGALLNFRRVIENTADDDKRKHEALLVLARLCSQNDRSEDAWEWSQALLALRPDHAEAREIAGKCAQDLAELAEGENDLDSALLYRQVFLALQPGNRMGTLKLGTLHLGAGRTEQAIALYRDLLSRSPQDAEVRVFLADAMAVGDPIEARRHYEDVLDAQPKNLHALASLAKMARNSGEVELAFALGGRAADVADDPVPYWLEQADVSWDLGGIEEAWRLVQEVFGRVPSHPQAVELGVRCCRRMAETALIKGDVRTARSNWEALLLVNSEDLEAHREVGRIAREGGDYEAAEASFARALALDPGDRSSAYELGLLLLARGDAQAARKTFAGILEQDPQHVPALLSLAELAWGDGDPEGSWYHTQELLALDPANAKGLALFGKLARNFAERSGSEGDLKTSAQWWLLAHKQSPRDLDLLRKLSETRFKLGELEAASDGFQRLMELSPSDLEAAHRAADTFRKMGNMAKTENALRHVVELDPRHAPSLRMLMRLARERGDASDVMRRAYDLLDIDPQDPDAMFELAWSHNSLLEKKASLQTYEALLALKPHHADSWHSLACLHRDVGDLDAARVAATNAIVYGPKSDYHVTLGTIYTRMGRWDEAVATFGQALALDPEHPDALAQLGFGLLQQRKPDQAKTHLEKAAKLLTGETELALEVRCALDLL